MGLAEAAEPLALRTCVVDGQVQDDFHVPLAAEGEDLPQILKGPEVRVYRVVIRHIVFVIGGRAEHRRQPDALDSETPSGVRPPVVEVVHAVEDAPQIAGAVPVRIGEGAHEDLVEDAAVVLTDKVRPQQRILRRNLPRPGSSLPAGAAAQRGQQHRKAQYERDLFHALPLRQTFRIRFRNGFYRGRTCLSSRRGDAEHRQMIHLPVFRF